MDISWNEDAVAAMRPRDCDKASGDLEVVAQGSLTRVLDTIAAGFRQRYPAHADILSRAVQAAVPL